MGGDIQSSPFDGEIDELIIRSTGEGKIVGVEAIPCLQQASEDFLVACSAPSRKRVAQYQQIRRIRAGNVPKAVLICKKHNLATFLDSRITGHGGQITVAFGVYGEIGVPPTDNGQFWHFMGCDIGGSVMQFMTKGWSQDKIQTHEREADCRNGDEPVL